MVMTWLWVWCVGILSVGWLYNELEPVGIKSFVHFKSQITLDFKRWMNGFQPQQYNSTLCSSQTDSTGLLVRDVWASEFVYKRKKTVVFDP